jgi:L-alanine-DL-glutamate epimerase-like enolase superfamily enzyme
MLWDAVSDLPLTIDGYELERRELVLGPEFTRVTTTIHLRGGGHEGLGEDVVYDVEDHDAALEQGATLPLAQDGAATLADFSDRLAGLELFPQPPVRDVSPLYRTWAYESAALDLALRQAGTSLAERLGRPVQPLHYVVSMRLPDPPDLAPVHDRLERYPGLRLKLDAQPSWDDAVLDELQATGAVASFDLKGRYTGTVVDVPADPALYERILARFPEAWLEDPHPDPGVERVLAGHWDRVTWDAPIHGIADIEALPHAPRMVNVKPSRVGGLKSLSDTYAYCERHGIGMYGGGQTELGVGRGHIQLLAALFHPDTPNDVAPGGFNTPQPPDGLPTSPMDVRPDARGFRAGG